MSVLDSLIHIKAFVFDVDGVMTDGNLLLTDEAIFLGHSIFVMDMPSAKL
jgi:3-deoxy-D-manno-octulosonate 8-phosphate phosphatase KdsC-like HAD superfamily phosphatase